MNKNRLDIPKLLKPGEIMVELGVAKGEFSELILEQCPDIKLVMVDRWAGDRGHGKKERDKAVERTKRFGDRIFVIEDTFEEAASFVKEWLIEVDLVYFDGYAHGGQEEGSTMEDWYPIVRPGGFVSGHDYHPRWPENIQAVNQFVERHSLDLHVVKEEEGYHSWYAYKPK